MKGKKLLPEDRLIISVDTSKKSDVVSLCKMVGGKVSTLKIGLELIYSTGPEIIKTAKSFGYKVMLDAKLMDIPNTVSKASKAIGDLGVSAVTVHTLGGMQMLKETRETLEEQAKANAISRPLLFGVTILTSLDDGDLKALGFKEDFYHSVLNLTKIALDAGMDGVVCSPNEVEEIRKKFGPGFYIATPGIRLPRDAKGDQKRISTPAEAILKGADLIVVGRPITTSKDIGKTVDLYLREIERAISNA